MGRHKCEVIACLSGQTQCEFMNNTELVANKFDSIWIHLLAMYDFFLSDSYLT